MGEQNISMQQLKQQRVTPAEKFVLDAIKGAKPNKPDEDGDVVWYGKDSRWLFTQYFNDCKLLSGGIIIKLSRDYGLGDVEITQLLTKLLYKYTNNGQLKVV